MGEEREGEKGEVEKMVSFFYLSGANAGMKAGHNYRTSTHL